MNVLLTTVGSHGDVHPFIAVGRALRRNGHTATLLVNPVYGRQVEEAGLGFEPLGERMELRDVARDYPNMMHHRTGGKVIIQQLLIPAIRKIYERVLEVAGPLKTDVVVSHHICFGAPWASKKLGLPHVNAALAPMMWMSRHDTITAAPGAMMGIPNFLTMWLMRLLMRPALRLLVDPMVNRERRELGLPKMRDVFLDTSRGGDLNLGLWSRHFRGPMADDPESGVICGFPWHDRAGEHEHPPQEIELFLERGEAPILFSLGTAAVHTAGRFYSDAAEACRLLRRRGMLLVGNSGLVLRDLPYNIRAFTYAPFSSVMPRCAASVHHGGIGTTAQGLRAGRPTVITPLAHDQFDNAERARRLGTSETVYHQSVTPRRLAKALSLVLDDPSYALRALQLAQAMSDDDGAARAAEEIERAFGSAATQEPPTRHGEFAVAG